MTLLALAVGDGGSSIRSEPILHADDQALQRGRAAFETLRVYAGRPFGLDEHLDRLAGSAERIGLPPVGRDELARTCATALDAAGEPDCVLRFYWTGGREGDEPGERARDVSPAARRATTSCVPAASSLISLQLGIDAALRAAVALAARRREVDELCGQHGRRGGGASAAGRTTPSSSRATGRARGPRHERLVARRDRRSARRPSISASSPA